MIDWMIDFKERCWIFAYNFLLLFSVKMHYCIVKKKEVKQFGVEMENWIVKCIWGWKEEGRWKLTV